MTGSWGKWIGRALLLVLALLLATVALRTAWMAMDDGMPREIRMATGKPAGMYHFYSETLQQALQARGRKVVLRSTEGTVDNAELVHDKQAELGIIQAGVVSLRDIAVIAPLAREIVHVIVRSNSGIRRISDLRGKHVVFGEPASGMRSSATQILNHYRIELAELKVHDGYFMDLLHDKKLDAAIVTAGFENKDLQTLLDSSEFTLLPIDGAAALALKHPHFQRLEIPKGLYREHATQQATPEWPTETVATTALLVCRHDAPAVMVREVLDALYDNDLQEKLSGLLPRDEVLRVTKQRWHKEAREYFDPFDQIGYMANVMESLAALKDLFWATGGLIGMAYILWRKNQRKQRRILLRERRVLRQKNSQLFKDQLDEFLKETIVIERELGQVHDVKALEEMLEKISEVKLRALNELTEETLRGNRMFLIFLQQCGHLSQAVRGKIWLLQVPEKNLE
ncbi:MAG: pknB 9 [Planctomycetaceae bacterium]|nr:pknB 9 [Planctomycetaceae bacterium]